MILLFQFPAVIELNVGGHNFTTLLQTLTKEPDSMLAALFSGRHEVNKDENGRYFIDADGAMFAHILNFLRVEQLPPTEVSSQVCRYASYFGIQSLVDRLQLVSGTLFLLHIVAYLKQATKFTSAKFKKVALSVILVDIAIGVGTPSLVTIGG